jgi:hypothetical protein
MQHAYAELRGREVFLWNGARIKGDRKVSGDQHFSLQPPTPYPLTGIAPLPDSSGIVVTDMAGTCHTYHWKVKNDPLDQESQ